VSSYFVTVFIPIKNLLRREDEFKLTSANLFMISHQEKASKAMVMLGLAANYHKLGIMTKGAN